MDEATFLQRCKELAGDMSDTPWTTDNMAGFFQEFRPDGERVLTLFADIPAGMDVYERLRQVYRATAAGSRGPHTADLYFVVRHPQPATGDELARYAIAQLTNWRKMAVEIGQSELGEMVTPIPHVSLSVDKPPEPDPNDTESLDVFIYDVQTDWHDRLIPLCPHASWMREAFYSIACDYCLAGYVNWPWYMKSSSIEEPYEPYFNLWLRGAQLHCQSPDNITLFIPGRRNGA